MKKMCEVCKQNPATVPDRERAGRLINRLCKSCHGNRLQGDIRAIFEGLLGRKLGNIVASGTSDDEA